MNRILSTGEMVDLIGVRQIATCVKDGPVGDSVIRRESSATGYTELIWQGSERPFHVAGFMFGAKWMIEGVDQLDADETVATDGVRVELFEVKDELLKVLEVNRASLVPGFMPNGDFHYTLRDNDSQKQIHFGNGSYFITGQPKG